MPRNATGAVGVQATSTRPRAVVVNVHVACRRAEVTRLRRGSLAAQVSSKCRRRAALGLLSKGRAQSPEPQDVEGPRPAGMLAL